MSEKSTTVSVPESLRVRLREIQARERANGKLLTLAQIISGSLDRSENHDDVFALIDSQ
jgi:hypothetical protein